jgi:hypothetical protein
MHGHMKLSIVNLVYPSAAIWVSDGVLNVLSLSLFNYFSVRLS